MSNEPGRFKSIMIGVMLFAIVAVDFTSKVLSIGIDLLLAIGMALIIWPNLLDKFKKKEILTK